MAEGNRWWRWYLIPVVLSVGVFTGMNALWNYSDIRTSLSYATWVYLLGGSGLALVILWPATRAGRLSLQDLGLDLSGWTAPRRLLGLAVILLASCGWFAQYRSTSPPVKPPAAGTQAPAGETSSSGVQADAPRLTWGDYCFWYFILLPASLAEFLVFVGVAFGLTRRGLQEAGMGRLLSTSVAVLGVSVVFGLYHFSHPPGFHRFIPVTIVTMFLALLLLLLTRNFYFALGFHNACAAVGFTSQQQVGGPNDPSRYKNFHSLMETVVVFAVPFLLLHWLEWRRRAGPTEEGGGKAVV